MVPPQVGFTNEGIINGIEVTMYTDCGWSPNDQSYILAVSNVDNGETVFLTCMRQHGPHPLATPGHNAPHQCMTVGQLCIGVVN